MAHDSKSGSVNLGAARKLASLIDARYRIPGTRIRFGWDSVIGLVPVAGDVATALPTVYFLFLAQRHRLPFSVKLKMGLNLLFDTTLGTLPLVGDVLDVFYKSNQRNFRLLEQALEERSSR